MFQNTLTPPRPILLLEAAVLRATLQAIELLAYWGSMTDGFSLSLGIENL